MMGMLPNVHNLEPGGRKLVTRLGGLQTRREATLGPYTTEPWPILVDWHGVECYKTLIAVYNRCLPSRLAWLERVFQLRWMMLR
jgi:hypothetical protein